MAYITKDLDEADAATEWMYLDRGVCDVVLGAGLTGTVVLEYRINGGTARQMYDKDGTAYSWTGPFNATIDVGGTNVMEYRLRCSAFTSGSATALLGYR